MSERILLVATRNAGKQREIRQLLEGIPYRIVFPDDVAIYERSEEEHVERGETFEQNARLKAEYFAKRGQLPTVAEDSGLEVFSLGGLPGVRSRRFAMVDGPAEEQDAANNAELLRRLHGLPPNKRLARYRCAIVFLPRPDAPAATFEGSCRGRILEEPQGTNGFGYDPIFFSDDLSESFGTADPAAKDRVSHRGQAFRQLAEWLQTRQ